MTPVEWVVYAAEAKLLLIILSCVAAIGFTAAITFAVLFGTISPRLDKALAQAKQAGTINKRLRDRIKDAEKEIRRVNAIRQKLEAGMIERNARIEALETVRRARAAS